MSFKEKIDELLNQKLYAALQEKKKMDPVGKADADIDNDGDVDDSDEYLHNRRKAIAKAMTKEETELDEDVSKMSANSQTWYRKGYEMGKDPSTYKNPPYGIGGAAMDAFRKGRKAGEAARNKKESVELDEAEKNEGSCGTMNASALKAMAKKKKLNAGKY